MGGLLLSYNAVTFLTAALLALVLVAVVSILKRKETHTLLLAGYFGTFALMMVAAFLVQSRRTESLVNAQLMLSLFLLTAPLLMQFAYAFPHNHHVRESRIMLWFSLISVLCVEMIIFVFGRFDAAGFLIMERPGSPILAVVALNLINYGTVFTVWVRKILILERRRDCSVWVKLLRPQHRFAKAVRSFILIFSLLGSFTVSDYLQYRGFLTQEQQYLVFVLIGILIFALFFLAYISHLPERSNLPAKLVGTAMLLVLPPMIILGMRTDHLVRKQWDADRLAEARAYAAALMAGTTPEAPPLLRYVLARPPLPATDDGDGDAAYRLLYRANHTVTAEALRAFDLAEQHRFDLLGRPRHQVSAFPERRRERVADLDALMLRDHYLYYDFAWGGEVYELGYSYLDLLRELHPHNLRLAVVQVATFLVTLLVFPLLLRRVLLRPLGTLMAAVRRVQEGDLDTRVKVYAQDEIGYLARGFNAMMDSFVTARRRLVEETEERTRLEAENTRKGAELEQARRLQLAMLPQTVPRVPDLDIAVYLKAATEVGGDYYDFLRREDGEMIVAMGDATGHGLHAGTMVTATKSLFNALAARYTPPAFMTETSRALAAMGFENMYMALLVARIREGHVTLSAAGMPYAVLYRAATRHLERVRLPGLPLGSSLPFTYRSEELRLDPGDILLLQSDGLEERFNPAGELMGGDRILEVVRAHADASAAQIVAALVDAGERWGAGRPQDDDITVMVLKQRLPTPDAALLP